MHSEEKQFTDKSSVQYSRKILQKLKKKKKISKYLKIPLILNYS